MGEPQLVLVFMYHNKFNTAYAYNIIYYTRVEYVIIIILVPL